MIPWLTLAALIGAAAGLWITIAWQRVTHQWLIQQRLRPRRNGSRPWEPDFKRALREVQPRRRR